MKRFALLSITLAFAATAGAQQAAGDDWHFLVEPYVMFPHMKGATGIGTLPPVHVDADPGDIFDHLQMGAMLFLEARNDTWAFSSDLLYMDLDADFEDRRILGAGSVGVSQVGWELAAMRRFTPWFEAGLGAIYNQVDAQLRFDVAQPVGHTEEWIDPTLVARVVLPLGAKWFLHARGNLAGFGAGSDLMWQLQADVGYRPSEKWQLSLGYRVIDFDYDQGQDSGRFIYAMQNFGPVLRLGYSF